MEIERLSHLPNFSKFPGQVPPSEIAEISVDFYNSRDINDSIVYVIGIVRDDELLIYSNKKSSLNGTCRYAESILVSRIKKYSPLKVEFIASQQ